MHNQISTNDNLHKTTTYQNIYNPNYNFSTPSGWRCPECGRVYSPSTPMCYFCGGNSITVTTTTATNKSEEEPEWKKLLKDYEIGGFMPYDVTLNYLSNSIDSIIDNHMFEIPLHNTTSY